VHILTTETRVTLGPKDIIEPASYILDDVTAAHLLVLANGGQMWPLDKVRPFDETKDWNGKRILFMRGGGFGDLTLFTPVPREIKRRWPQCHVAVSTMSHYAPVLQGLPFIDSIEPYPVTLAAANTFDAWVWFENAVERNPRAKVLHMTDLFAEITGLKTGWKESDKRPAYLPTPREIGWAMEQYPRNLAMRRLCIHVGASAHCRKYHPDKLKEVVFNLMGKGWQIFLIGAPGEAETDPKVTMLRNLTAAGLTFRQSCAVVAGSDCLLGGDSAFVHIAGALDVPCVALYGPFPWKLRTAYSPSVTAISGVGSCAPCFHHVNSAIQNHWPEKGPCAKAGYCTVLADIKPDHIAATIERVARKFELKEVT
jgi:ADP-heptose:LPS heptosyltransferase